LNNYKANFATAAYYYYYLFIYYYLNLYATNSLLYSGNMLFVRMVQENSSATLIYREVEEVSAGNIAVLSGLKVRKLIKFLIDNMMKIKFSCEIFFLKISLFHIKAITFSLLSEF
jgi:hypothetical protein